MILIDFPIFSHINHLFLWAMASMAMLNYQRVDETFSWLSNGEHGDQQAGIKADVGHVFRSNGRCMAI